MNGPIRWSPKSWYLGMIFGGEVVGTPTAKALGRTGQIMRAGLTPRTP